MSQFSFNKSNPFDNDDASEYIAHDSQKPFYNNQQRHRILVNESEDRQLESTQRAIASLYESETLGNTTAEELLRQREVIGHIEEKTDEVNLTLATSQRHINNIKSVFGGIKNWWTSKKDSKISSVSGMRGSSLDSVVKRNDGGNVSGKSTFSGSTDLEGECLNSCFLRSNVESSTLRSPPVDKYLKPITGSAREEELEKNFGLMGDGLGRLKDLARGLGDEIDIQNSDLDRIKPKMNRANDLIEHQNKQVFKILKR